MDRTYPELRPWQKLVGVNGDLADIFMTVLSLAGIRLHAIRLSFNNLHRLFNQLEGEFPHLIPRLLTRIIRSRLGTYYYSRILDNAIVDSYQLGIRPPDDGQHIVVHYEEATKNIELLRRRAGDAFIEKYKAVAKRLAEIL